MNDNDWGKNKMQYYAMNKRENDDDSDFVEDEKEAVKLQKMKLERIKKAKLLEGDSSEEEEEKSVKNEVEETKEEVADLTGTLEVLNEVKNEIDENVDETEEVLDIVSSEDFFPVPKTKNFLSASVSLNYSDTLCQLYNIMIKVDKSFTNHHPVLKSIATIKYLKDKASSQKEKIQKKLDKLLEIYQAKKIKIKNEIIKEKEKEKEPTSFLKKKTKRDSSFIDQQKEAYEKLEEKENKKIEKSKKDLQKEIKMKNEFAVRHANKEVIKARGIYRKRKQYAGNAKVANREKYYKKQKEYKKMVKQYEGKPDVYGGEATGIRRDLVRSTLIKS